MRYKLFAGINDFALHCLKFFQSYLVWEIIARVSGAQIKLHSSYFDIGSLRWLHVDELF